MNTPTPTFGFPDDRDISGGTADIHDRTFLTVRPDTILQIIPETSRCVAQGIPKSSHASVSCEVMAWALISRADGSTIVEALIVPGEGSVLARASEVLHHISLHRPYYR